MKAYQICHSKACTVLNHSDTRMWVWSPLGAWMYVCVSSVLVLYCESAICQGALPCQLSLFRNCIISKTTLAFTCRILGSQSNGYEEFCLLGT
jgi:hypothetical protein